MNTIQLEGNITFEQYQKAVSLLEGIGLRVKKEETSVELLESLKRGLQNIKDGKVKSNEEVQKMAEAICGS